MNLKQIGAVALAGASACMLSGCLIVSADVKGDYHDDNHYSRLLGVEVSARAPEITIIAHSNGCTEKSQFEPRVRKHGDNDVTVAFQRVSEDRCKAFMPEGKRLTWSFSDLGIREGASVRVLNVIGR